MLLFILLITLSARAQFPSPYTCYNISIPEFLWPIQYPTVNAFTGFFRADGSLSALDPNGNVLFTLNISGSVYHQYYTSGLLFGDLFLNGLPGVPPGYLVLTSHQTINPVPLSSKLCQIFLPPTPANLINSYSEIIPLGVGYMTSAYYSLIPGSLGQIFSNEFFSLDSTLTTGFSETNDISLGNGLANHYTNTTIHFRYTPITYAQAQALGYTGSNPTSFNSVYGFNAGKGVIPVEIFSAAQRAILGF